MFLLYYFISIFASFSYCLLPYYSIDNTNTNVTMKRRADEMQFGARTPQRIITTQHSSTREYKISIEQKVKQQKVFPFAKI